MTVFMVSGAVVACRGVGRRMLFEDATDWVALHSLIRTCLASKVAIAAAALLEKPNLFSLLDTSSWAKSHLPTAGKNAQALLELIRFVAQDTGAL